MDLVKILIYAYVIFFVGAGINHFLQPQFYDSIVPSFIPFPRFVHQFTGLIEIVLPLFLLTKYRKEAALLMIIFREVESLCARFLQDFNTCLCKLLSAERSYRTHTHN